MQDLIALVPELLLVGVVTGFLAGLLGIGGGMMLVPILTLVLTHRGVDPGMAVKMAIATAMATILFTSAASVRAHHLHGAVRWDLLRGMAPGIVLGGVAAGAGVFSLLKGQGLALVFAAFVGYSSVQMLRGRPPKPGRQMPGPMGQSAVGAGIGLLSGLLGAGGAFLAVPFMTWCNVPIRQAVGTGAALGFPVAAASVLGYLISGWSLPSALPGAFGYLYLPGLLIIVVASMTMAPIGARIAHRSDVRKLRKLFALLLLVLAANMLHHALA
ncbi:MAG: hypothetical protein ABT20_03580 [Rubrivivax sp. SCN 70-15]|nr:MAG: hypothetical protein ABT20_03580 [Rubrivivax sp. SCN 70-15]